MLETLNDDQRAILRLPLNKIEEHAIRLALAESTSASAAAQRLGMGRSTLYRKMQDLGIRLEDTAVREQLGAAVAAAQETTRAVEQRQFGAPARAAHFAA